MKLNYFLWFGILALATIMFSKREHNKIDTYTVTSQIKGIAIILVIFGHLSRSSGINAPVFNLLGAEGVTIFLLISGYGLFKSYNTKGITLKYWTKRIKAVLIPYSIITAIFLCYDIMFLNKDYPKIYIFKNVLGIDNLTRFDGTMWYIQFILSWYIIFGIVFYFKNLKDLRIFILFLFSLAFYSQMNREPFSMYYYQCAVHSFWFSLGILIGRCSEKLKFIANNNFIIGIIVFIVTILSIVVYGKVNVNNNLYMIYNLCIAVSLIGFILLLANFKRYSKLLNYIGTISFYLYLFEGVFIYNYNVIDVEKPLTSFLKYFIIVIVLSVIYKSFIDYIIKGKFITKANKAR